MKCIKCGREMEAGKKFCSVCGAKLEAYPAYSGTKSTIPPLVKEINPPTSPFSKGGIEGGLDVFQKDKYLFHQKILRVVEKYDVLDEYSNKLFFVRRKFFALKRDTYIFKDESEREQLLTIKQDTIFQFLTRPFSVIDSSGNLIATIVRDNIASILRRRWRILSSDGVEIARATEDSAFKAFLRRFMPFGQFLKTDFIIMMEGKIVGKFIRKWTISDRYVLDLTADIEKKFDRRIAICVGILLDTGEIR